VSVRVLRLGALELRARSKPWSAPAADFHRRRATDAARRQSRYFISTGQPRRRSRKPSPFVVSLPFFWQTAWKTERVCPRVCPNPSRRRELSWTDQFALAAGT